MPMIVLPNRGIVKVLRGQYIIQENLGTELNTGQQQGDVCGGTIRSPSKRYRWSADLLPRPELPRCIRAHYNYEQRDLIDSPRHRKERYESSRYKEVHRESPKYREEQYESTRQRDERHNHFPEENMSQPTAERL